MPHSTEVHAVYHVTTPCFCGGADGQRAEFRMPSFKGVLRFWWRALAWSRCGGDLGAVKVEEDHLFGSAAGGRSRVSLSVTGLPDTASACATEVFGRRGRRPGAHYLCYGLVPQGREVSPDRPCLRPFTFAVAARYRLPAGSGGAAPGELTALVDAFKAVGLFGGMGAKSRKGFGSLTLASLLVDGAESWSSPGDHNGLRERIRGLMRQPPPSGARPGYPAYTAFSEYARVLLVADARSRDPVDLIDQIGRELKDDVSGLRSPVGPPLRRAAFGLPRNFGAGQPLKQLRPERHDRRASPLFLHLHDCAGTPVGVLSYLPARFLPDGEQLSVSGTTHPPSEKAALYRPVEEFLERLSHEERLSSESLRPAEEVTW